jgi:hypothetical protein
MNLTKLQEINNIKDWNTFNDFNLINNANKNNLNLFSQSNSQNEIFFKDLGSHNFISNFNKNIYFDINNLFNIKFKNNKYEWKNTNYSITNYIKNNNTILFLENKFNKTKKVLKVFNNTNVNYNKIENLKLDIHHISNNHSLINLQNNYYPITEEQYKIYNFNRETESLNLENSNDKIYLSCRTNDAVNNYINNLIIQKIHLDNNIVNYFVQYENIFVTQVENKNCYCILMDNYDGNLTDYIDKQDKSNTKLFTQLFNDIEIKLQLLKNKKYLFNHTNLICESILYKNDVFYIADNKYSSIKYNNIRFLNDYRYNTSWYNFIDPYKSMFAIDNYSINNNPNNHDKNIHHYRLSRKFRNVINSYCSFNNSYDFEKLYIRYNFQPFYMSFDMITFILSLLNKKLINGNNLLISKYIDTNSINQVIIIYYHYIKTDNIDTILELLLKNQNIIFIHQY